MKKLSGFLAKYLLGRDISDYYKREKAFYMEYILNDERLKIKKEEIDRESRNQKILCCWIPNIPYLFGIAALVFREPSLLAMNAGGESLRWIGRYFFEDIKRSNEMFQNDEMVFEEFRADLPEIRVAGHDTRSIEDHLVN